MILLSGNRDLVSRDWTTSTNTTLVPYSIFTVFYVAIVLVYNYNSMVSCGIRD